jgi:hypothetical protein
MNLTVIGSLQTTQRGYKEEQANITGVSPFKSLRPMQTISNLNPSIGFPFIYEQSSISHHTNCLVKMQEFAGKRKNFAGFC